MYDSVARAALERNYGPFHCRRAPSRRSHPSDCSPVLQGGHPSENIDCWTQSICVCACVCVCMCECVRVCIRKGYLQERERDCKCLCVWLCAGLYALMEKQEERALQRAEAPVKESSIFPPCIALSLTFSFCFFYPPDVESLNRTNKQPPRQQNSFYLFYFFPPAAVSTSHKAGCFIFICDGWSL